MRRSEKTTLRRGIALLLALAALFALSTTAMAGKEVLPFKDVPEEGIYCDAIHWAYDKGITNGNGPETFGTDDYCTRGQVITFLYRAAGKPGVQNEDNPYIDVEKAHFFYYPVLWAKEQGIAGGTSPTTFDPSAKCSTAHIITFLYRANNPGKNGWYEEARDWAGSNGLLEGTRITADRVSTETNCTRGDVAVFLYRCYAKK